jgi:hypothetical protein
MSDSTITDAQVEAGAIGLWLSYKGDRPTISSPDLAIRQGRQVAGWDEVAIKDWYRRRARAVLEAAAEVVHV